MRIEIADSTPSLRTAGIEFCFGTTSGQHQSLATRVFATAIRQARDNSAHELVPSLPGVRGSFYFRSEGLYAAPFLEMGNVPVDVENEGRRYSL